MKDTTSQRGATLLLVIGVIAALAVLSAAMVVLFVNVQHNTMTDRMQTTAFNVAEAGIEAGQSALWGEWPSTVSQAGTPEIPAPLAGGTVAVKFYDDDGLTPPGIPTEPGFSWDQNANGKMWVESVGTSNQRSAKIMVCVLQVPFNPNIRGNVALFAQSNGTVNGQGSVAGVGYEGGATGATVYIQGTSILNPALPPDVKLNPLPSVAVTDIVPDETLLALIRAANGAGKVYADEAAALADTPAWSTTPRIMVIQTGDFNLKNVPNTDSDAVGATVWSEDDPGVLIALDPAGKVYLSGGVTAGDRRAFYGLLYAMGNVELAGNPSWHGMILASGTVTAGSHVTISGTRAVIYNPKVIAKLNQPAILAVQRYPNTWRELTAN